MTPVIVIIKIIRLYVHIFLYATMYACVAMWRDLVNCTNTPRGNEMDTVRSTLNSSPWIKWPPFRRLYFQKHINDWPPKETCVSNLTTLDKNGFNSDRLLIITADEICWDYATAFFSYLNLSLSTKKRYFSTIRVGYIRSHPRLLTKIS